MKKPLVTLAVVLIGMFSGGVALALTVDQPKAAPTTHSSESSDQSNSSDSSDTESSDTDSSDTESSDSGSQSTQSADTTASGQQPANHGLDVSSAAHNCPHGPNGEHGKCVSAVAHG